MRKGLSLLIAMVFLVTCTSTVFAAANWRHGKSIYKKDCMNCHKRGGEAKRLRLNSKTKAAWTKFVNAPQKGSHEALWQELTEQQKEDLLKYFTKYAKDNSSLLGCG
ncbi:MAG: cytochrome c [Desulfuromonas sp.]|nr:cytochrome c [Desulfuromonas sp.]